MDKGKIQIFTDKAKVGVLPDIVLVGAAGQQRAARVPVACACCRDRPSTSQIQQQSFFFFFFSPPQPDFKAFGLKLRC